MKAYLLLVIIVALFLVACSPQQPTQPAPVVPQAPEVPQPAQTAPAPTDTGPATNTVTAAQSGTDKTFGTVNQTSALKIDDVLCDKATKTITFRFRNDDTKSWQMNQNVPFPTPMDLAAVRIFINKYEANNPNGYTQDGVRFFGPATKFSDNCGGVEVMKPGDDVTCTLTPVPLAVQTQLSSGKNQIFVDSPTSHHVIEFLCN